jgi:CRP-like cAMP-binding protein
VLYLVSKVNKLVVTNMKQILLSFPAFRVLEDGDLDWLKSIGHNQTCQPGTVLMEEDKSSSSIYICISGNLVATVSPPGAGQQQLTTFTAGEVVGETLLLDNKVSTVTVLADNAAEILVLPKQQIIDRLKSDDDFAARFYLFLAINLSERLRKLTNLMSKNNIKEGEPLRKVLIVFAILKDSDIAWMVSNGVTTKARPGIALIEQGQAVPAVYLLLEGMLGIYVTVNNNGAVEDKEIATRVKGEILGEMSFVDGGVASASVKSIENAWVLALPQKTLTTKFQEDRGFAQRFYHSLVIILSNRCLDLLIRGSLANFTPAANTMLSEDIEVEDELDMDTLEGTAIAGRRFDWIIKQLRR